MLCANRQRDAVKVVAAHTAKQDGPFICPECSTDVILKKCRLKVDHFAHRPPVTCQYGSKETEQHRACKTAIFDALAKCTNVTKLELERHLKEVRPDVSCYISGVPVAIEVQLSALSYEAILRRTEHYARKKIYVLWVAQWTPSLDTSERYSPRVWEKWCHAAYFGRVYYWKAGRTVVPYHFDSCLLDVPLSEWHDENGDEMSAGGYTLFTNHYRIPAKSSAMDIARDFVKCDHAGFTRGSIEVPQCRIFKDRYGKFDNLRIRPAVIEPEVESGAARIRGEDLEEDESCPW